MNGSSLYERKEFLGWGKAADLKAHILTAYQAAGYDREKKSRILISGWISDEAQGEKFSLSFCYTREKEDGYGSGESIVVCDENGSVDAVGLWTAFAD